jgi:hypothetical protein
MDLSPVPFPFGKGCLLAKINALRELQSASGEELSPTLCFGKGIAQMHTN